MSNYSTSVDDRPSDAEFLRVVKFLEELKVEFYTVGMLHGHAFYTLGSMYHLETDELLELKNDRVGFYAKIYGVSKEQYLRWEEARNDPEEYFRCKGYTSKGKKCKVKMRGVYAETPREIDEALDWYCPHHESQRHIDTAQSKRMQPTAKAARRRS